MIKIVYSAIQFLLLSTVSHAISPAKDAREFFSAKFYRLAAYHLEKTKIDFVVSPAATQKFLVAFYKGMAPQQADQLLFDIGLKHIDFDRWMKETYAETHSYDIGFSLHLRDKQLRELAPIIEKTEVLDFFKNDFQNTSSVIKVENYIVVPEKLKPKPEYEKFAKEYFNVSLVHAETDADKKLKAQFGVEAVEKDAVELYSQVEFDLRLPNSINSSDGNLLFEGDAKYFEDSDGQYIELTLENGLELFVAAFTEVTKFDYYITQTVDRHIKDFDIDYRHKWSKKSISLTIPAVNFENVNDLAKSLREDAKHGLKHAFSESAALSEAFENWPDSGHKLRHFWQRVAVNIGPSATSPPEEKLVKQGLKNVSAVDKNFFYAIRNDKTYYAMGGYITKTDLFSFFR